MNIFGLGGGGGGAVSEGWMMTGRREKQARRRIMGRLMKKFGQLARRKKVWS